MDAPTLDPELRFRVYDAFAAAGRAPTAAALASALGVGVAEVRAGLERLDAAHALVLDRATREVRMALPFSNVPTHYRVESGARAWDVNCAWDALALVRLLALDDARIADDGAPGREARRLRVAGGALLDRDGAISSPRPAWRWWEDIVFT
jgi:hypothetical protein